MKMTSPPPTHAANDPTPDGSTKSIGGEMATIVSGVASERKGDLERPCAPRDDHRIARLVVVRDAGRGQGSHRVGEVPCSRPRDAEEHGLVRRRAIRQGSNREDRELCVAVPRDLGRRDADLVACLLRGPSGRHSPSISTVPGPHDMPLSGTQTSPSRCVPEPHSTDAFSPQAAARLHMKTMANKSPLMQYGQPNPKRRITPGGGLERQAREPAAPFA